MLRKLAELPPGERAVYFNARSVPLHAMLGSVGHSRETSADYDWHGLKRGRKEFVLFQYTLSGAGRLRVSGREHEVGPGAAMLLHFPADNRYWLPATSPQWEFIYLCLHGREVMRLWPRAERTWGSLTTRLPPESPPVKDAAAIVRKALRGELTSPFMSSALAYGWLMTLLTETSNPAKGDPHAPAMERAKRHAEENLASPLGVDDLADAAGLSRFHFTRLFKAHVGASPAAWLVELRVKEAAHLLRETRLPLKEIAERCGFGDPGYFGKVFRQLTGQPPGSYRRSGV